MLIPQLDDSSQCLLLLWQISITDLRGKGTIPPNSCRKLMSYEHRTRDVMCPVELPKQFGAAPYGGTCSGLISSAIALMLAMLSLIIPAFTAIA